MFAWPGINLRPIRVSARRCMRSTKQIVKAAPDDFYEQLPPFFKLLEAFNWPLYELDDYEADDIMAAFAQQARQIDDLETILVSSDLDMLQALGENTKIFLLKNGFKKYL